MSSIIFAQIRLCNSLILTPFFFSFFFLQPIHWFHVSVWAIQHKGLFSSFALGPQHHAWAVSASGVGNWVFVWSITIGYEKYYTYSSQFIFPNINATKKNMSMIDGMRNQSFWEWLINLEHEKYCTYSSIHLTSHLSSSKFID